MTKERILYCDPGIDDAVTIALCCASDELDLLGITTTHGNVALERTTTNTLALLDVLNQNISVYAGADRPLVRPAIHASNVHGASGFGGVEIPMPRAWCSKPDAP
ncbi:nucleoside hydrolase [Celeribacter ethanolicus]|uniref:nucleoside hydrolase n=1 Tax=Celeribacter ethanolicus TaxID=1758178 RepID=UPI00083420F9|nr:nucleoside hydrolase [Celeribacter ethanolicus]